MQKCDKRTFAVLRLIYVIVMLHVVFKRHILHKYLLFYYQCSFTSWWNLTSFSNPTPKTLLDVRISEISPIQAELLPTVSNLSQISLPWQQRSSGGKFKEHH